MYGLCLVIEVVLSNDLAFLLSHLLLSTLMNLKLVMIVMMVAMLTSCGVFMFWGATIFGFVLMLMRRWAEANLLGGLLLWISSTTRALRGFLISLDGLGFVWILIYVHLYTSLSNEYALGTNEICIFLCLQLLISRPFNLDSIDYFHRNHWYDILPGFRWLHIIRRCWRPMYYLRGH